MLQPRSPSNHREQVENDRPVVGREQHHQMVQRSLSRNKDATLRKQCDTVTSNFVSFYFTNVPYDISYYSFRQGFEVCGVMEDVYLARKCNVNGGAFGFVRYRNVKDIEKLLKAVNNMWFGDWRMVAKVASFDRFGNKRGWLESGEREEKILRELKNQREKKERLREGMVKR